MLVNGRMAYGAADGERVPERFFVVDSTGAPVAARFTLDRRHFRYAIRNPENPILGYFSDQPLGDSPLLAVDPRGRFVTVAQRSVEDLSSEADSASVIVRRIDPAGDTAWTTTLRVPATSATEELRNSVFASEWDRVRRARGPGMSIPEKRAALEEVLYLPEVLPPVDRAVIDFEGNTWLRRWRTSPSSPARWLVINMEGELVATASGPAGVSLLDHRNGRAVAGVKGQLDVQYVIVLGRRAPD